MEKKKDSEIMVSVCMITYNHEKYIRKALESVLMQKTTYSYEIIIGDDCSPDRTVDVIRAVQEEYPEKIELVLREKNLGMCANSYDVRCRARGKYIAFLEGDDYWLDENKIQNQVDFLESHKECPAIAGCMLVVNESGHPLGRMIPDILPLNRYFEKKDAMKYQTELLHPGALMYRNFIKDNTEKYRFIGHTYKNFGGHKMLIFLLASMGGIYISDDPVGAYRFVKRASGANANSLVLQNRLFWEKGKIDAFLYMKKYMYDEYDFSPYIANSYIELKQYMDIHEMNDKKKISSEYFAKMSMKERVYVVLHTLKNIYK